MTPVAHLTHVVRQAPEDPEALTEDVREVMAREEFQYGKGWFDRLAEWIQDRLSDLFGDAEPRIGEPPPVGGVGSVVAWVLIVAAVVAIVVVVVHVLRNRIARREPEQGPDTETEVEHRRSAREWASAADRYEAEGRWKEALRARYRELVRTLVDRGQVPDVAGRTTGELRIDLARTTPAASEAFDEACTRFELAWYADVPTDAEQVARVRDTARVVLAAPVERRDGAVDAPADVPTEQHA